MQIITEIPDGKPGRPDYQGSRFLKRQPGCDLPKKTEVATGRKPNAFLTGKVPPIATDYYMESNTDETETNLTTSENCKRLLNYILCIRFFIEVHSIVSASRFFHMPTYLRVVIECQSRFFPFFPAFSRNCPDYFLHTSGSSSFRSLSDLGAR